MNIKLMNITHMTIMRKTRQQKRQPAPTRNRPPF